MAHRLTEYVIFTDRLLRNIDIKLADILVKKVPLTLQIFGNPI